MKKNILYTLLIVLIGAGVAAWLLLGSPHTGDTGSGNPAQAVAEETPQGPNGGRLLRDGDFSLEITIFEQSVPPEFRVYSYQGGELLSPEGVSLVITLTRIDGQVDTFNFRPEGDYLRGDGVVTEPHSFDVTVAATHRGEHHEWAYENYEGRVRIADDIAAASGIKTENAGPQVIDEVLELTGRVEADPDRLSRVRARFPGVIRKVSGELGARVRRGAVLAEVQSNESLQDYRVEAPIDGMIVQRDARPGEATGDAPLFTIADLSTVWIALDVFDKDATRVRAGQSVLIETLDGASVSGTIDWLSPVTDTASQSVRARVVLPNSGGIFRPGRFVRGRVTVAEQPVPLAVRRSGIQRFRDFEVVFARFDDVYEVRMLELGRGGRDWVEVRSGLKPGTGYVTENSYLIKADIEKSGASHDH